jgi:hypothetical protein
MPLSRRAVDHEVARFLFSRAIRDDPRLPVDTLSLFRE